MRDPKSSNDVPSNELLRIHIPNVRKEFSFSTLWSNQFRQWAIFGYQQPFEKTPLCPKPIRQTAKDSRVDFRLLQVKVYLEHTFDIYHIFIHTPGQLFVYWATSIHEWGLYVTNTFSRCGFHKFPHTVPSTKVPQPLDARIVGSVPSRGVYTTFAPQKANTMGPSYVSSRLHLYLQATTLPLWMKPKDPSNSA